MGVKPHSEKCGHAGIITELNEWQTTFAITQAVKSLNNKDKIYEFNQQQPDRTPPCAHEEGR